MDDSFPERGSLAKAPKNYLESLTEQLAKSVENLDLDNVSNFGYNKVEQVEEQVEYAWIRIYLYEEDNELKSGDVVKITYMGNEVVESIFGAYEKEGLTKDHDDEVINYVSGDDHKILCCMVDIGAINRKSDHIPNLRTFFRSSWHYQENLFFKDDLIITSGDREYKYHSISF